MRKRLPQQKPSFQIFRCAKNAYRSYLRFKKGLIMALFPQDHVFWYLNNPIQAQPLTHDISTDVLVVGGGMAGITTAQAFHEKGYKVTLIEKTYCGAGASGKS